MSDKTDDKVYLDYEPGSTDLEKHSGKLVAKLTLKQMTFLDAFAETMDVTESLSRANASKPSFEKWMNDIGFQNEMQEIYEVFRRARKMTAKNAAVNHLELIDKLNRDYDASDLDLRSRFANPLVKASDTWLKATSEREDNGASNVTINIDLGGDDKVTIKGGNTDDK